MLWATLLSVVAHHGEGADPDLLVWIKHRLDELFNLGPWTVVILLGAVIAAIPLAVAGFYWWQQRRVASPEPRQPTRG
jgi:NhaP-type Na+/H+ or K+/H+ antiporter